MFDDRQQARTGQYAALLTQIKSTPARRLRPLMP
jgi:hypothetical protein